MTTQRAKTAAILCSGGDAPGMNGLVRSFTRLGINGHGWKIIVIKNGFLGLVRTCDRIRGEDRSLDDLKQAMEQHRGRSGLLRRSQELVALDHESVAGLMGVGGIVVGTVRCDRFRELETRRQAIDLLAGLGVDALVVVGGEGSLSGAALLARENSLTVVGIPATIDNDVPFTESALGFDTAVSNVVWAVERCNDTALSHNRIMVVQAMGRNSGQLAIKAALAAGVEIVVVPEQGLLTGEKMLGIGRRIEESMHKGQTHAIVLVAEGVKTAGNIVAPAASTLASDCAGVEGALAIGAAEPGPGAVLASALSDYFGRDGSSFHELEVRHSVLGHLQRGGSPTVFDRVLAVHYADAAWQAITAEPPKSAVVGWRHGRVIAQPFEAQSDIDLPGMTRKEYVLQKTISRW